MKKFNYKIYFIIWTTFTILSLINFRAVVVASLSYIITYIISNLTGE